MREDYTTTHAIARFVASCGWLTVLVGAALLAFGLYGFTQGGFGAQQAGVFGSLIGLSVAGFGLLLILWGQLTRAITHTANNAAELVKLPSRAERTGTAC
jgi:hypothetical protein